MIKARANATPHHRLGALGFVLVLASVAVPAWPAAAADQSWPAEIKAHYRIVVAGFELGKFDFSSKLNGQSYVLTGAAQMSWGFGMFSWASTTRSTGIVHGDTVTPATYTFDYKASSKTGSTKLGFDKGNVTSIDLQPQTPPSNDPETAFAPLKAEHRLGVLDPISALIAGTRGTGATACSRRLPVFDGRQRFDLIMTPHRQEHVAETRPSGQPGTAHICRAQYLPLGGHKLNKATQDMASNKGIEVALRPLPSTHLLMAHRITIPTGVGLVEITLKRAEITGAGGKNIVLTH